MRTLLDRRDIDWMTQRDPRIMISYGLVWNSVS